MKTLAVAALLLFVVSVRSEEDAKPQPDRRVVVTPFENKSKFTFEKTYKPQGGASPENPRNQQRIDRLSQIPREDLEDIIAQFSGVKPVERDNLDSYLMEQGGRTLSEIDVRKVKAMALNFNADAVVVGTVLDVTDTTRTFSGYQVNITNHVWLSDIRIRVFEMKDKNDLPITFSKKYSGSFNMQQHRYVNSRMDAEDFAIASLKDALDKVRDDPEFHKALRLVPFDPVKGSYVEVPIDSSPDEAVVRIEGDYRGETPTKVRLLTGSRVKVQIKKAGYEPWEESIVADRTLKIRAKLQVATPPAAPAPNPPGKNGGTKAP